MTSQNFKAVSKKFAKMEFGFLALNGYSKNLDSTIFIANKALPWDKVSSKRHRNGGKSWLEKTRDKI